MKISKKLTILAAMPLMLGCGVIDSIQQSINEAIGQLTAVSEGNLQTLVGSNSDTLKSAGEQLEALKSSAKPEQTSRFSLGDAAAAAPSMTLIPLQFDGPSPECLQCVDANCAAIGPGPDFEVCLEKNCATQCVPADSTPTKEPGSKEGSDCIERKTNNDKDTGIRQLVANYDKCPQRKGTIISQLTEDDASIKLNMDFRDFVNATGKRSGVITWTMNFLANFKDITISSNEQIKLTTRPDGYLIPVTTNRKQTINYTLKPEEGTLGIEGSSSDTQEGGETSTLSFAGVVFQFGPDSCGDSPIAGAIAMSGKDIDGGNASIEIKVESCGVATKSVNGGTPETVTADQLKKLFSKSLNALDDFFVRLDGVVDEQNKINQCKQNSTPDNFETKDQGSKSGTRKDNNTQANAAALNTLPPAGGVVIGKKNTINFSNDDWYKISLTAGNTYAIEAIPKATADLWPFVCVRDAAGKIISTVPAPPADGLTPLQGGPLDIIDGGAFECFPGFAEVKLTGTGSQEVFIEITDFFGEYQCQEYDLVIYDVASNFQPPAIEFGVEGCPAEWIDDPICDQGCHGIWENQGLNFQADKDACTTQASAFDPSGTGCPLEWIGDGVCDQACISTWGATAKNPFDPTITNGTDDGGDCAAGGGGTLPCGGPSSGQALCSITGALQEANCVPQTPSTGCDTNDCPFGEAATYSTQFNDITCVPQ